MLKALDLCCKAGGATKGLQQAGFYVTGVDIQPQPHYCGDEFIQADIKNLKPEFLKQFDLIWASPPCQAYSTLNALHDKEYPKLIPFVRQLLKQSGKPYIIENVPGAPLENAIMLCGSSFRLRVRRHRCFETSFFILAPPCSHEWQDQSPIFDIYEHGRWFKSGVVRVYGRGGGKGKEHWSKAMGIDWMNDNELAEAIPPAYSKFLAEQFLNILQIEGK